MVKCAHYDDMNEVVLVAFGCKCVSVCVCGFMVLEGDRPRKLSIR